MARTKKSEKDQAASETESVSQEIENKEVSPETPVQNEVIPTVKTSFDVYNSIGTYIRTYTDESLAKEYADKIGGTVK